jgi:plasmid stability protein
MTLAIDETLLRQARIRALEQGTSVNAVVREYLERYVGTSARDGVTAFLGIAERARASSGVEGRSWSRDALYDR